MTNKEEKLEKMRNFIKNHLGIDIKSVEALKKILKNPEMREILQASIKSAQEEERRMTSMDHGYSYRDDYWRSNIRENPHIRENPPRVIPGYTDSEGVKITHVQQFQEIAEKMMAQDPNIIVRATRNGIEISYIDKPEYVMPERSIPNEPVKFKKKKRY